MKLSILIPAHNESATVAAVLRKVWAMEIPGWEKEIVVIDDGSSDGTAAEVERWAALLSSSRESAVTLVRHGKNLGKGAAIQTGLRRATGEYVIIQDADLEYDPGDIPQLVSFAHDGKTAVFGRRGYQAYPERGFHYVVGAWLLTAVYNFLFRQRLTDLYTGYKLVPTAVFQALTIRSTGFELEAEIACKLANRGVRILETPIRYTPRSKRQGKHLRYRDGILGLWTIMKLKFGKN